MFKQWGSVTCLMSVVLFAAAAGVPFLAGCAEQQGPTVTDSGTAARANGTAPRARAAADSGIDWNRLTRQAVNANRPVYILFTAPWCPHCRDFERDTLTRSDVRPSLNRVIYIKANFDREKPLAHRFGFTAIPSGVLLRPQNNELVVVDKHVGGLSPAGFVSFLNQAHRR